MWTTHSVSNKSGQLASDTSKENIGFGREVIACFFTGNAEINFKKKIPDIGFRVLKIDENVPESVVKAIAKRKPLRAVFRDSSFANGPDKINVTEIFKLLAPNTRVKVI